MPRQGIADTIRFLFEDLLLSNILEKKYFDRILFLFWSGFSIFFEDEFFAKVFFVNFSHSVFETVCVSVYSKLDSLKP